MKHTLFALCTLCLPLCGSIPLKTAFVMTVKGPVPASELGTSLIHEHVLVDFIGADSTHEGRWDKAEVVKVVLPYLREVAKLGVTSVMECTPSYLGKDPVLLRMLADSTGMHLLTNTGYYGAVGNKYLPAHAHTESAQQLAARWIRDWKKGFGETGIRPGFMKISVESGPLSPLHTKLVEAAALTHLKTGLTIASHTGPQGPAFEQVAVLKRMGVAPEAFIWVHSQAESDISWHLRAAKAGFWVSLDGVSDGNAGMYLAYLQNLKEHNLLHRVLISHDAGWYRPGEENGGYFRDYRAIHTKLLPLMRANGFTEQDIRQLLVTNPAEAFAVRVRKLRK